MQRIKKLLEKLAYHFGFGSGLNAKEGPSHPVIKEVRNAYTDR
tara:strand:- start:343 stop:471 length:129 start_codon:yes stop_codon:yes gene_type:complete